MSFLKWLEYYHLYNGNGSTDNLVRTYSAQGLDELHAEYLENTYEVFVEDNDEYRPYSKGRYTTFVRISV